LPVEPKKNSVWQFFDAFFSENDFEKENICTFAAR